MGGRKKAAPLLAEKGEREMLRLRSGFAGASWRNLAKAKNRPAQPPARAVRVPFRVVARCKADRSRTPPSGKLKRLLRSLQKGTSLSTAGAAKGRGKALGGRRTAAPLLAGKGRRCALASWHTCLRNQPGQRALPFVRLLQGRSLKAPSGAALSGQLKLSCQPLRRERRRRRPARRRDEGRRCAGGGRRHRGETLRIRDDSLGHRGVIRSQKNKPAPPTKAARVPFRVPRYMPR
jgi:hypothetical protein